MRQCIVAYAEVERQPGKDVPVIVGISGVGVIHPVVGGQTLKLLITAGESQQEVCIGILRVGRTIESKVALCIGLLLLVFVRTHVAKAELKRVQSFGPGQVVADLVVEIRVVPRPVIDRPVGIWRPLEVYRRKSVQGVIAAEDSCRAPAGGLRIDAGVISMVFPFT